MVEIDPAGKIFIGRSTRPEYLTLKLANRHGLVTGATGTGKTVTLQVMAEGFARAGVPVFAADIGKSIGDTMGGSVGRAIVRGTLGGIFRRRGVALDKLPAAPAGARMR